MSDNKGNVLKISIAGLVIGILVVGSIIAIKKMKKPSQSDRKAEPVYVSVIDVRKRHAEEHISFVGTVAPFKDVLVSAETGGRYTDVPVEVGSEVEVNDVLARIDDSGPEAALQHADAELEDAIRELDRIEKLAKTGAVAQSVLDAAVTRKLMAEAVHMEARAQFAKCTIKSPLHGRVEEKHIDQGEYALDGKRAFRIADLSSVKVIVFIPEADITDVGEGQKMNFKVSAYRGEVFEGVVTFVGRVSDEQTHAFRVELEAANPEAKLRAGMIAEVMLRRSTAELVAEVPFSAVLPRKGDHIVFLFRDGRAVRRTVRIYAKAGDKALIASGLEDGDNIVVEGQKFLQDGERIEIRKAAEEE